MRVKAYKRIKETHKDVAVLLDKNTILLEDGIEMPYDSTFNDTKIFTNTKLAKHLWNKEKIGEVQTFDRRIIKWRKKCPAHYKNHNSWPGDSLEVTVLNSSAYPDNPKDAVKQIAYWRDWVEENGGNIKGTLSNTSLSLFKSSLNGQRYETPFTGIEEIKSPLGGRLLPCKSLRTTFYGDFVQYDIHSAYSRTLGNLQFGGLNSRWIETRNMHKFDSMIEKGYSIYIEAEVEIPDMRLGPLPIRRDRYFATSSMWDCISFPTNSTMRGIWTYEEIREADRVGCKIKIIRIIYHQATGKRYWHEDWYNIILSGRNLPGFAKSLAKQTGNSLWGRYAMRPRPSRTKWRDENGERHVEIRNSRVTQKNQCMELADQLCGKIRAPFFEFAVSAGDNLLQGNIDGGWVKYNEGWNPPNNDWRDKHRATRIDIIDDRIYRYWEPGNKNPEYIAPGIDLDWQEKLFNQMWNKFEDIKVVSI